MLLATVSSWPEHAFPPGTFDVRGWPVRTRADDEKAGVVHDILVDRRGVPRFLDVDLGLFRKHVLLPVGSARADREREVVWVPGHTRDQFRDLPGYDHEGLDDPRSELVSVGVGAHAPDPRPPFPGTVYGPSEVEENVVADAERRLAPLASLDGYRVAEDERDVRGWTVALPEGARVGVVADLVVDTAALKVGYLACELDPGAAAPGQPSRTVLIPVEYARLDESGRRVVLDALGRADLRELPICPPGDIGPELEEATRASLGPRPLETELDAGYRDTRHFYGLERE